MERIFLNGADSKFIQKIHGDLINTIEKLPKEMLSNERIGAWVFTAAANIVCRVSKMMKFDKMKTVQLIIGIWDKQELEPESILN